MGSFKNASLNVVNTKQIHSESRRKLSLTASRLKDKYTSTVASFGNKGLDDYLTTRSVHARDFAAMFFLFVGLFPFLVLGLCLSSDLCLVIALGLGRCP